MKLILRQDHETLGKLGDVVDVKDGYARNFLIPKKIGFEATPGGLRRLEEEKKQHQAREHKELHAAQKLAEELEKLSVTLPMKVGEDDKLYGSVTNQMIAEALLEKSFTIDKRSIEMDDSIKALGIYTEGLDGIEALGIYTVNIHLHQGVDAKLKVWVVRE